MAKIKTSLLVSFAVLICLMLFLNIFIIVTYSFIEGKYRAMSDSMILEYRITESFSKMIDSYTSLLQDANNTDYWNEYESAGNDIEDVFGNLEDAITFPESIAEFSKIKSMTHSIKTDCDSSLAGLSQRNFTQGTGIYDRAIRGKDYVREGTANLILKELEYSKELQASLQTLRKTTIAFSVTLILISTLGSIFFALFYSNRLSAPLMKLSNVAESISNGNLEIEVSLDLLNEKNEVGTLSNSFKNMLRRLKLEIKSQKEINTSLVEAKDKLQEKNQELEEKKNELVDTNAKLEETNQKLFELDKKKDEFISVTSHELKTPLVSIKGFSQILRDKKIKDEKKKSRFLDLIDQNTNRLYSLILDIVDASRISLGQLRIAIDDVSVQDIMADTKTSMHMLIKEKGLKASFEVEPGLPKVRADKERVLQILRNLITNAVKFTRKGSIALKAYRQGPQVNFEIRDTGIGIPKDKQQFMFTKYYQVDGSYTKEFGGSGLGLSICKGLLEQMKGKIWFNSEEGKGSTFYFSLPIADKVNSTAKPSRKSKSSKKA
ncbi:HAMP domain-containing histidine kinase [Candidatus Woesearchaeota archaeon]|nr:HAMP domain-containing histidine kinase [Candidatus Woesearchaeota archaeon]